MQRDQDTSQTQPLMTIKQVQRALGLSRSMVYLLISRGELQVIHIGTAIRVKPSEIRRFVRDHEAAEQVGRGRNRGPEMKQRKLGTKRHGQSNYRK